jgi:hypothetical protein
LKMSSSCVENWRGGRERKAKVMCR